MNERDRYEKIYKCEYIPGDGKNECKNIYKKKVREKNCEKKLIIL